MAKNLRVSGTHAYHLYREVEPIPSSPRIDPQQPRDENSQQPSGQRSDKDDQSTRRFIAMRTLINKLEESGSITRVDFLTTESELHDLGLSIAEDGLVEQLLELKFSLEEIDQLFLQIRQQPESPEIETGHSLSEANNFFPVFIAGLSEYNLHFQQLQIQADHKIEQMADSLINDGRFVTEKNRLRLDFQQAGLSYENNKWLLLDISILVAVSEIDESGRRVILYQRPNQSYALYADKQIDLSI